MSVSDNGANHKRSLDTPESSEGGSIQEENDQATQARKNNKRMKRGDVGGNGQGQHNSMEEGQMQQRLMQDAADDDAPGSGDDSSSDDDDDDDGSGVGVVGGGGANGVAPQDREIQVEFEARSPQECDFYGLVHLLKQMLRPGTSNINVSDLADRIISQRAVGSVITQSPDDADDTDDEEDNEENAGVVANAVPANGAGQQAANPAGQAQNGGSPANGTGANTPNNEVFGVGTVLKLVHGSSDPVGDQIVSHLLLNTTTPGKSGNSSSSNSELRSFLQRQDVSVGFLISERILNMPPQISVPMYETLQKELRKAVAKNLPFDFTHFVMISRQFVAPDGDDRNVIFTNAEEEVFIPECDLVLDMNETTTSTGSTNNSTRDSSAASSSRTFNSSFTSDEYVERRKLLVFKANKLEKITNLVKGAFPIN